MNNSILKRIVVAMLMISALFFSINPLMAQFPNRPVLIEAESVLVCTNEQRQYPLVPLFLQLSIQEVLGFVTECRRLLVPF